MVWKKGKYKKIDSQGSSKLTPVPEEPKIKGFSKAKDGSDQESSQDSSKIQGGDSTTRDHITSVPASRSVGSRSGDSCGSDSSSIRRRVSVEQESCNSAASCGSSERGSRKSDHGAPSLVIDGDSDRSATPSVTSQPRAANNKRVRFDTIQFRDYERVVGDNPSCTSGPPVGIGWSYGQTRKIDVDTYEKSRPNRKISSRLILSREEREALLLNWGASFHDIVESIRGNLRIKNQRRQTVTNLGKIERIEEAFESATRKLKRALLLRRGNKLKRLQEQANLAQSALTSLKIAEDRALSAIRRDRVPTRVEPDKDFLEDYEFNVAVANIARSSPVDVTFRGARLVVTEHSFNSSFDTFSTGGNSTTPSQLEMERFYRELELEMFGDEELPSMVGQTLEVPAILLSVDGEAPPPVTSVSLDEALDSGMPPRLLDSYDCHIMSGVSQDEIDDAVEAERNRSMISQSLLEDTDSEVAKVEHPYDEEDQNSLHYHYPMERMYPVDGHYTSSRYHSATSRLSSSLDSSDPGRARAAESIVAMEYELSQHRTIPLHAGMSMFQDCALLGGRQKGLSPFSETRRRRDRRDTNAGPKVQHMPPQTHLSPSQWMEDQTSPRVFVGYDTITISEDGFGERDVITYRNEGLAGHYVAAQQFPSSFY